MKKGLLIVAAVLMLAGAVQAGELKVHNWPCTFTKQQFMTFPVTLDVGYYILVKSQTKYTLKLNQTDPTVTNYFGCVDITVQCNFPATLSLSKATVTTNGDAITGSKSWDVKFAADMQGTGQADTWALPGTGTGHIFVCGTLQGAQIGNLPGGQNNIQIATVTIYVVPTVGAVPCTQTNPWPN